MLIRSEHSQYKLAWCWLTPGVSAGWDTGAAGAFIAPLAEVASFNCDPAELTARWSLPLGLWMLLEPWPFRSLMLAVSDFASS
jgi:hypothetical protein